jgi:hypothetical protein
MNTRYLVAAAALLASIATEPQAQAQGAPTAAAAAARRQKLAAQQAAAIASAKAAAAAAPTTAPTPAATINRPAPTATATTTAAPTATAAPTTTAAPTATTSAAPKPTASAAASAAPATSGSAAPAAVHPDTTAIALDIEALRKSRPDRRHAEFVDMHSRWGNLLTDPRAADELKLHAQRLAYLQRIRALGAKDATFVKGVDALITKEETRDSDALNALRSGALPTTPAAAPAAGATK